MFVNQADKDTMVALVFTIEEWALIYAACRVSEDVLNTPPIKLCNVQDADKLNEMANSVFEACKQAKEVSE